MERAVLEPTRRFCARILTIGKCHFTRKAFNKLISRTRCSVDIFDLDARARLTARGMRRIQCLKLLRRERKRERDSVLFDVVHRAGFGDRNYIAAPDSPGQRHGGRRATMRSSDARKRGITQQFGAFAAERRISHDRYAMPLAPWHQVTLNTAIAEVVGDLVGCAAVAVWHTEKLFHIANPEVGHAPGAYLFLRAQVFKCGDNGG